MAGPNLNVLFPTAAADAQSIQNRRLLAMKLLEDGQTPIQSQNGGLISPYQGLAKMLNALSGTLGTYQADEDSKNLAITQNQQLAQLLTGGASAAPEPWTDPDTGKTIQQPSSSSGGGSGGFGPDNMPANQRLLAYALAPDAYGAATLDAYKKTDLMKNDAYRGINPSQSRQLALAAQAKDMGLSGATPDFDASGNMVVKPVPGAVDVASNMAGATQRAQEENKILSNMTVNGQEGVPVWGADVPRLRQNNVAPPSSGATPVAQALPADLPAGGVYDFPGDKGGPVNIGGTPSFGKNAEMEDANKKMYGLQAENLNKSYDEALAASKGLTSLQATRDAFDKGMFTGSMADQKLFMTKFADALGMSPEEAQKAASNTEVFSATIGSQVMSLIKGLGSGTSITDSDRNFVNSMVGGNIKLQPESIKRLLDITEKASEAKIDQHNQRYTQAKNSGLKDLYDMKVPKPEKPKAPLPINDPRVQKALAAGYTEDEIRQYLGGK